MDEQTLEEIRALHKREVEREGIGTHSGSCHRYHSTCALGKLLAEVDRLRAGGAT